MNQTNQQVLICKTSDNRKIYYDEATESFGSIVSTEKTFSVGVIAGGSTISYVLFRGFQNLSIQFENLYLWYFLFTGIGIFLGMVLFLFKKKRKTRIYLKNQHLETFELKMYLDLAEKELSDAKTTIFLCLFTVMVTMFNIFYAHISLTFILIIPLWIIIFYLLDYFDLSKRGRVLRKLKNSILK